MVSGNLHGDRQLSMERRQQADADLVAQLDRAITRGELEVLFQPKFLTRDDSLIGGEALARWESPDQGRMTGDGLFRLAARSGLTRRLSHHVWNCALAAATRWPRHLRLSLNITASDLAARDFPGSIIRALLAYEFAPDRLTLEITEQALLLDLEGSAAKLQRLVDMGISIALDDFGAGFCNFRYLKLLPLQALKLDRSMVEGIADCERDLAVLRAIVAMALALDLQVVAEGIETRAQRDAVAREGCLAWQGFLGGRPMRGVDFVSLARG